ncbi:uncharacterized protein ARMOST_03124 [Armillaria ostoyae]|uniref:Uncharacterized protein n=1 Tax=Armillaria ostoyae TaxID=47428 RepID=A0A284QTR6_ARMOS|nr:uncharacterized protein ARMOST_03124 [Armillaria ostoyae]
MSDQNFSISHHHPDGESEDAVNGLELQRVPGAQGSEIDLADSLDADDLVCQCSMSLEALTVYEHISPEALRAHERIYLEALTPHELSSTQHDTNATMMVDDDYTYVFNDEKFNAEDLRWDQCQWIRCGRVYKDISKTLQDWREPGFSAPGEVK